MANLPGRETSGVPLGELQGHVSDTVLVVGRAGEHISKGDLAASGLVLMLLGVEG